MKAKSFLPALLLLLCASPVWGGNFIEDQNIPVSLDFLPPPPAHDSPDFARDLAIYERTRAEVGGERWRQAIFDADMTGNLGELFREALGLPLTRETTPATYELLELSFADLTQAAKSAKDHYMRVRPFVYFDRPRSTCVPADEHDLRTNGSYPSGHANRGWAMALILARVAPEKRSDILRRGYEIGQSRVICGVHWVSDVEAAYLLAAAVVAQMSDQEKFQSLLARARDEIQQCRQREAGSKQ